MEEEFRQDNETNDKDKKESDEYFDFFLGRTYKKSADSNRTRNESSNNADAWILGRAPNDQSTLDNDQQKTVNNIQDYLQQVDIELLMQNIDLLMNSANELKPLIKKISPYLKKWID